MASGPQSGDLARCVTHEADDTWPSRIEIVAYWGPDRRGKRRSTEISADEFFGRKGHGAPMTGEQVLRRIDDLRRK